MTTTVAELKKYLKKADVKTSGNKAELVERFKNVYDIPKKVDNPVLYHEIREKVKKSVKAWPSAYASGMVVQAYKNAGGTYSGKKAGDLKNWYQEKWVNICETDSEGQFLTCSSTDSKRYPYCRPSIRVSKQTPKTVQELSPKQRKAMCAKKKSTKRIYLSN